MGVHGLKKLLAKYAASTLRPALSLDRYRHQRFVIDAPGMMHRYKHAIYNDHEPYAYLSSILKQYEILTSHGISCIYVFDGAKPACKHLELEKRRQRFEREQELLMQKLCAYEEAVLQLQEVSASSNPPPSSSSSHPGTWFSHIINSDTISNNSYNTTPTHPPSCACTNNNNNNNVTNTESLGCTHICMNNSHPSVVAVCQQSASPSSSLGVFPAVESVLLRGNKEQGDRVNVMVDESTQWIDQELTLAGGPDVIEMSSPPPMVSIEEQMRIVKDLEHDVAQHQKRAAAVTTEDVAALKALFLFHNIPFVMATGEGEKTCAWMTQLGLADVVVADDTDALAYGAKRVLMHLMSTKHAAIQIQLQDVLDTLRLSFPQFVDMCMLCGCDFVKIPGVAWGRALEIIRKHLSIDKWLASTTKSKANTKKRKRVTTTTEDSSHPRKASKDAMSPQTLALMIDDARSEFFVNVNMLSYMHEPLNKRIALPSPVLHNNDM